MLMCVNTEHYKIMEEGMLFIMDWLVCVLQ